ncbi:MAG TPA: VTT domain-containing protein [Pyrinomonadaceae bacterium]|nr:VTT domain-containing protein [Pyrinomonadaceae bacterium]
MFEWLSEVGAWLRETAVYVFMWLQQFIVGVPIYVAGPAMIIVGALDSSLLSLPEINDYLVVIRCMDDHKAAFYFPLFAAAGSVLGSLLLYSIMRRGGQALLRRRFRAEHIERVERAYARFGVLTLAVPAILPPPMPFKIFVATAGALEYPRWRFVVTIMVARSLRYTVEGALAVFYGKEVLTFLHERGLEMLGWAALACLAGLACYLVWTRLFAKRRRSADKTSSAAVVNESEG